MDQSLFEAPRGYSVVGSYRESMREEEDDLLQFAIQQSLLEAGSEYDQVIRDNGPLFPIQEHSLQYCSQVYQSTYCMKILD